MQNKKNCIVNFEEKKKSYHICHMKIEILKYYFDD